MPTKSRNRDSLLDRFIGEDEVLLSSEVISRLCETGYSRDAARQLISRQATGGLVWRSNDLKLSGNERLFARKAFRRQIGFFQECSRILKETDRRGFVRVLDALAVSQVLCKPDLVRLLAISPVDTGKGSIERELKALAELGVKVHHRGGTIECVSGPSVHGSDIDELAFRARRKMDYERVVTNILIDVFRKQNIIRWNQVDVATPENPLVVFNKNFFSAIGYSYLSGIRSRRNEKLVPAPVLIDCYTEVCSLSRVQSFNERFQHATIRNKSKLTSIAVIAARDFETDAWSRSRELGFMTINLRQMFGEEALDAMIAMEQLVYDLNASNKDTDFGRFSSLIDELKTNPVVISIQSTGFEIVAGLVLKSLGFEQMHLGKSIPWKNTTRDVDVYAIRGDELRVIECKAYHSNKSVSETDVNKFFHETVPALKGYLRKNDVKFTNCIGEIWTTGSRGAEAEKALAKIKGNPSQDEFSVLNRSRVLELLPQTIRTTAAKLINDIAKRTSDAQSNLFE
jgi:hypothetical protein